MEDALEAQITRVLRESAPAPLRAIDIVRALAAAGAIANKESVNRVLYHGPFDRDAGSSPPTWRARPAAPGPGPQEGDFAFQVDRVAGSSPLTWRARPAAPGPGPQEGHFAFQVDGVGLFCLRDDLPRESLEVILAAALGLAPDGAAVVRSDGSAAGKTVAELAAGRAIVALIAI